MDALVQELTLNDIQSELYRMIAEEIGIENLCKLAKLVGGSTIYMPKLECFVRPVRDVHIKEEFNGYNHSELAKKYGVTERWIKELCGSGHLEGQYNLFETTEGGN